MNNKEIKLTHIDRKTIDVGKGFIPCEVSDRYLNIKSYDQKTKLAIMDVMTSVGETDKKLTELVINLDKLKEVLIVVKNT